MMVRVLVHEAHVRVLVANVIAILCCSIVNFYVGNRWAFADIQMPPLSASEADKLTNIPVRKLPLRSHYYRVQIEVRT